MDYYNRNNYKTAEGDIANGTLDSLIGLGSLANIVYVSIDNDSTTNGITVKFDSTSNESIPILAGENLTINNVAFTSMYLSNQSGASVHYRILIVGHVAV